MRNVERDFLLFLLAAAAGSADGWSYMGLGHAFVANMTGNTVLVGLAVFTQHRLLDPLAALLCYAGGAALAAWMTRDAASQGLWPRAVARTLLLEAVLMVLAEAGWAAVQAGGLHICVRALLAVVAFAVGLQSGAMIQLRIPGIVTTYITGTWTTLLSGLATFRAREGGKPAAERRQFEERLLMQAGIVGVYLGAAVLAGWLFSHWPAALGAVPSVLVLAVAGYGMVRE